MKFVAFTVAFGFVLIFISLGNAFAQDTQVVVADLVAPWLEMLVGAVSILVTAILGWIAARIQAKTGIDIEARHREALQTAITNAAGLAINRLHGKLQDVTFDVRHPAIKQAVDYIGSAAPDAVRNFGLTPEQLAEKVVAKLGLAQAPALEATPGVVG